MSDNPDDISPEHAELLALLKTTFDGNRPLDLEAAPASVVEGSMWVHDWVTADAELADLVSVSPLAGAGTRSSGDARKFQFKLADGQLELTVELMSSSTVRIVGETIPRSEGALVLRVGGVEYTADSDPSSGVFILEQVRRGMAIGMFQTPSASYRLDEFDLSL